MTKVWWKSKTLWFNIITVVVGVIGEVTDVFTLNAQVSQIFAGILAVGNFILRFLTDSGVTASEKE